MNHRDDGQDYLAAFRAERPGAGARRRNWAALQERMAAEDASGPAEAGRSSGAGRLAISIGITLAIAAAVLLMIRGLGQGLMAARERHTPAMEAVDQAAPAAPRLATPARPVRTSEPPEAVVVPNKPAPAKSPAGAPKPKATVTEPAASVNASPAEPSVSGDLAAETALMATARTALGQGKLSVAREALQEHERRFAAGVLQEERRAYQAIVACREVPSAEVASEFFDRYPSSPHAARVRKACESVPAVAP